MIIQDQDDSGIVIMESTMQCVMFYDLYSQNNESGDAVLLRADPKNRVIISPSGYGDPSEMSAGQDQIIIAGTPQPLYIGGSGSQGTVKAFPTNTGRLYINAVDLFCLDPGEDVMMHVQDIENLNIDGDVTGDGYCWMTETEAGEFPSAPLNPNAV